ncbi:glycoside hydrolase family 99-like domain-containing protein [Streptococcus suis]|uniref:glycosyltransferase WbsX family protein n=1 Tax=Streptococcus suis TaxID=1307 RepID=UPI000CF3F325|nr:glycoside hydrolase family 99-like domain-containing protein [Streptococcus suis]NQN59536.1 glycoside hydrolase family 99-like domain-containing protein [Streptococcus suis]HEM4974469.1 glycoside hydrolase family 99-like domain-containing protein [Streptococcus suis]HEM5029696.1 glycoside hydrolase family 99-like domain-containing protein [Streptococcus suis]HEM5058760.1 glycoside hydrolase family 99-like domain-containing protein [Streptococcus suis]HEM5069202.1 glycoside hydrolase family 
MRPIAFYLPQFHAIPENDEWWGEGFTEWTNMKAATPLFEGHLQPRIPLDNNYYNLLDEKTMEWQVELAKKYGLYGFCFYHYWFNGHMLLEKPMEMMLNNPNINFPYMICWANEPWTNAWKADGNEKTLIAQHYGREKEWKQHFEYLLQFFKDKNYIVENNKPMLLIYRPEIIECLNEMLDYWNELAIEAGFSGIDFAYQQVSYYLLDNKDESRFKYRVEYQPGYARYDVQKQSAGLSQYLLPIKTKIRNIVYGFDKKAKTNLSSKLTRQKLSFEDYDELCQSIINRKADDEKSVAGMFVDWDNTPRRGDRGRVCLGSTPEKFQHYMTEQIKNVNENYQNDMLFIFAWNEWAEGGYLEPDERNKYGYLEALKESLQDV